MTIDFLISFSVSSTSKLTKFVALSLYTCKATQGVPIDLYTLPTPYSSKYLVNLVNKHRRLGSLW